MKNMTKKKKIVILSVMVALLLVTGFVNVALNSSLSDGRVTETSTSSASFYATYRSEREATRTQEIQFYDSIIASASSSTTAKEEAEVNKMALIAQMEKLLDNEDLRKKLIRDGKSRAMDFDWKKCSEKHLKVYKSLL